MISLEILMFLLVVIDGVLIYFYIEKTKDITIIVEFSIEFISIVLTIITTTDISLFTSIIHGLIIVLMSILFVIFIKIL
ncbi:hypothetical protein [uncultured Parvimonas sp.]|jgi:hypothetical protein|uniref:hypothetical protein n=1 Tax=Parvimonas sp. G1604 TaxID=3388845 RepID=UPI0028D26F1E|nr:hypothetical protein [uncultured Parvimonas sp.]